MAEIGKDINKAAELLGAGQLVAIPTETVYGLAANALDASAVLKIFDTKNRPKFDPLIVHIGTLDAISQYAADIPDQAFLLARRFWPGPLTLVLKKADVIPDIVTSGLSTVGIRCPDHALTAELLSRLPFPLAAPSANPFGYVSPTTATHVNEQLGDRIPYILDGGPAMVGLESTIVGFDDNQPVVYRVGGLAVEEIEKVIGQVLVQTSSTSNPRAPGQLISHYAPGKHVVVGRIEDLLLQYPAHRSGILTFNRDFHLPNQIILSPKGELQEAAQNLFAALREFDKMPVDVVLAELVPDEGIGRAINDRLKRAAVPR